MAPRRDWLLTAASWLAMALIALLAIIALAMPAAIAAVHLYPGIVFEELGKRPETLRPVTWALTVLLTGFIGFAALGIAFLVQLRRMIATVAQGIPFTPANARRLARMGWIMAAGQALSLLLSGFARYLKAQFPDKAFDIEIDISMTAILVTLLLFILARVFARGAAMQDELEATI